MEMNKPNNNSNTYPNENKVNYDNENDFNKLYEESSEDEVYL